MKKLDKNAVINYLDEAYEEYGLGTMVIIGLALTIFM